MEFEFIYIQHLIKFYVNRHSRALIWRNINLAATLKSCLRWLICTRGVQKIRGQMLPFLQFFYWKEWNLHIHCNDTQRILYVQRKFDTIDIRHDQTSVVMVTLGRHTRPNDIQRHVDVALSQSNYWLFLRRPKGRRSNIALALNYSPIRSIFKL